MNSDEIIQGLSEPFPAEAIHWRVGSTNKKSEALRTGNKNAKPTQGIPLPYVNARDVMDRLDDILGAANWQDKYIEHKTRIICELSVYIEGEWITKSDGAGDTNMQGEKGGVSDAFKRAAVKFGVARYLYKVNMGWANLDQYGRFVQKPELPQYALPTFKSLGHCIRENFDSIHFIKRAIEDQDIYGAAEAWQELEEQAQYRLMKAPSRGGVFETHEIKTIREQFTGALNGNAKN